MFGHTPAEILAKLGPQAGPIVIAAGPALAATAMARGATVLDLGGRVPTGVFQTGSSDVFFDGRAAATVAQGQGPCAVEKMKPAKVSKGAKAVFGNAKGVARIGDTLACGAVVLSGPSTISIGNDDFQSTYPLQYKSKSFGSVSSWRL